MPPPRAAPPGLTVGTGALLVSAGMVAAFGWTATHGGSDDLALVAFGAVERGRLWDGELWRFLAAPFLCARPAVLVRDVVGVLVLGTLVERALGRPVLAWTFAVSSLAGAAAAVAGEDVVAAGAGPAVLGLSAAVLVDRVRGRGELARSLRPRLGWLAAALLVDAVLPSMLPAPAAWHEVVSPDRFELAGGFLGGGAAVMAATAPRPRWRAALPLAAALLVVVAAAVWPRPGPTALERHGVEVRLHEALRARDVDEAERLLADADRRGLAGERLTYYRALARAQRDRLEEALELLRPLDRAPDGPFREEVRRQVAGLAHLLGYRRYTGDGRPRDPRAGLAAFDEACTMGDAEACTLARRIRGGPGAP